MRVRWMLRWIKFSKCHILFCFILIRSNLFWFVWIARSIWIVSLLCFVLFCIVLFFFVADLLVRSETRVRWMLRWSKFPKASFCYVPFHSDPTQSIMIYSDQFGLLIWSELQVCSIMFCSILFCSVLFWFVANCSFDPKCKYDECFNEANFQRPRFVLF
jgi:hypothetical protein